MAGGSEAQNEEAQALAAQTIGCKPFNRTAVHMQACISHLLYMLAPMLVCPAKIVCVKGCRCTVRPHHPRSREALCSGNIAMLLLASHSLVLTGGAGWR